MNFLDLVFYIIVFNKYKIVGFIYRFNISPWPLIFLCLQIEKKGAKNQSKKMSLKKLESTILDFRHFLDESLTFVEFFESGERDRRRRFFTSSVEIARLREHAVEFNRLTTTIKNMLEFDKNSARTSADSAIEFGEFNTAVEFTESFRSKRLQFFTVLFGRMDKLYDRLDTISRTEDVHESVRDYFRRVHKLSRRTNEFIGYLETSRWHRAIALEILDRLVVSCNKSLRALERFVEYLASQGRIRKDDANNTNLKTDKQKDPNCKTSFLNSLRNK